jgi:hypothetical protein
MDPRMELLVALIVLMVGVSLEMTRPSVEVVRVRSRRR